MNGGLLRLGSDITARRNNNKRICFAVRVLQVEPSEEDRGGRDNSLSELEFLA